MKNLVLFLLCSVIILSACSREQIDNDGEHDVVIFFTTGGASLKSTATQEEKEITEIILFGVDSDDINGNFVQHFIVSQAQLSAPEGVTLPEVSRRVKTFYAIANPSAEMKATVTVPGLNAEYLTGMTGNFSTYPESPFLMSGKGNIISYTVNIDLIRTVARIEITALNDLVISKITVENTPNTGYVFPQSSFAIPTTSRIAYENINPVSASFARIYVAENSMTMPTRIIVNGVFEGNPVNYPFYLKQNDNDINIVRNKNYKVEISPTMDAPGGFTINIPDWEDVDDIDEIIIPD